MQTAFVALDEAQKVCNRRVNALEFVVIPRLEETVFPPICLSFCLFYLSFFLSGWSMFLSVFLVYRSFCLSYLSGCLSISVGLYVVYLSIYQSS